MHPNDAGNASGSPSASSAHAFADGERRRHRVNDHPLAAQSKAGHSDTPCTHGVSPMSSVYLPLEPEPVIEAS